MLFLIAILEYMAQRKEPVEKEKWKIGERGIMVAHGSRGIGVGWGGGGRDEGDKTQVKLSVLD